MRFLVDANLPRSAVDLLRRLGHEADHVRDAGLGNASDSVIAAHAQAISAVLLTRDLDFADVRYYPPETFAGIVVLRLPDNAVAKEILTVLERFMSQTELIAELPGRLAVVEPGRARFRPPV